MPLIHWIARPQNIALLLVFYGPSEIFPGGKSSHRSWTAIPWSYPSILPANPTFSGNSLTGSCGYQKNNVEAAYHVPILHSAPSIDPFLFSWTNHRCLFIGSTCMRLDSPSHWTIYRASSMEGTATKSHHKQSLIALCAVNWPLPVWAHALCRYILTTPKPSFGDNQGSRTS